MLYNEFTKLFHTKAYFIALMIGVLSSLTGLISYYDTAFWSYSAGLPQEISAFNAWLDCLSTGSSVYRLLVPLIIIPFLDSYYIERKSGYQNFILARSSRTRYFFSKWFVGSLSAATIVLFTLVLTGVICALLFPLNPPLAEMSHVDRNFGFEFFLTNPMRYIFLLIICNMFFAAVYYTIGFGLTNSVHSRYVLLLAPFAIYIIQLLIWQLFRIPEFSPLIFIAFYEVTNLTPIGMRNTAIAYLMIAVIMLLYCYRKDIYELA